MSSHIRSKILVATAILMSPALVALCSRSQAAPPVHVFEPEAPIPDGLTLPSHLPVHVLPESFDLRDEGRAAQTYPENGCASCWSTATTYIMESLLLSWEETDLSETHMQLSQVQSCLSGASAEAAMSYLTAWRGPIAESDYQRFVLKHGMKARERLHVRQVRYLPLRKDSLDNSAIKRAIYNHGPLYASVNGRGITNPTYNTSYAPYNSPIHAVALIGWDDRVPQDHFTYTYQGAAYTPAGDGAFIVRDNGGRTYYLSYYDGAVGHNQVVWFSAEPTSSHQRLYQHDPYGTNNWLGPYRIPDNSGDYVSAIYGANRFTAIEAGSLSSIGLRVQAYNLYTPEDPGIFEVAIHLDPDNGPVNSHGPTLTFTTQVTEGGFVSIDLPSQIPLHAGQRFSVVVRGYRSSKPIDAIYLPVEQQTYDERMSIGSGESFVSRDGWSWFDMTDVPRIDPKTGASEYVFGNLGIKAYTKPPANGFGRAAALATQLQPIGNLTYLSQLRPWRPVLSIDSAPIPETATPQPGSTVPTEYPTISLRFTDTIKPGPGLALISLSAADESRQVYAWVQNETLSIQPVGGLGSVELGGKQWTVRVPATAVVDRWNNPMEQDYSWSFLVIGAN